MHLAILPTHPSLSLSLGAGATGCICYRVLRVRERENVTPLIYLILYSERDRGGDLEEVIESSKWSPVLAHPVLAHPLFAWSMTP